MSLRNKRPRDWLASLVQIQEGGSSEEFLESVKVDLFPDKVYVFTPKGKILRLPSGATAVDFAYAIHTDVGNRCVAAKVDRRLVPLRTRNISFWRSSCCVPGRNITATDRRVSEMRAAASTL